MKNKLTHTEIVKKLIGNINPCGKTEIDKERLENLIEMCYLVDNLVCNIDAVAYNNKDSKEHSVKEMADYASNFLSEQLRIEE